MKKGGKRTEAGHPKKKQKTITISLRVLAENGNEIKEIIKKMSIEERTNFFNNNNNLAFYDSINNMFEDNYDLKSIKEYVDEVFIDGNQMHPDFFGFDIYKKIGSCKTITTDEIRDNEPVWKVVYSV